MKLRSIQRYISAFAAMLVCLPSRAQPALSLEPSLQSLGVGSTASVELRISGLGDGFAPSLGGFEVNLSYDPAILSAVSVTFGSLLDLGGGSLQFFDLSLPGVIRLDETSFESAADLIAAQPAAFTLATLSFMGLTPGLADSAFTYASLSDEQGATLQDFSQTGANIEVLRLSNVPDGSSTACLMLLAAASLGLLRKQGVRV